jgi:hypothetical protein
LDNRRSNLRTIIVSEDRNKKKKKGATSKKYLGVSWDKKQNVWVTNMTIKEKRLWACYKIEEHAAHQYNNSIRTYIIPIDFVVNMKGEICQIISIGIEKNIR